MKTVMVIYDSGLRSETEMWVYDARDPGLYTSKIKELYDRTSREVGLSAEEMEDTIRVYISMQSGAALNQIECSAIATVYPDVVTLVSRVHDAISLYE